MSSKTVEQPPAGSTSTAAPPAEPVTYVQTSALPVTAGAGGVDIEVDDDSESSYESGYSSETTSATSSIFSFTYANGRRYHADRFGDIYFMPNDDVEQDRLDLVHHMFLSQLGGMLYKAPLEKAQRVLDVGTGTGIWAIDFADMHKEAEVIGVDISPIQPRWVPPNTKFEVDDMEQEWTFKDNQFDYIHMRSLSGSFSNWDYIFAQAYSKTAPGGYIEFQDYGMEPFLSDGTKLQGIIPEHPPSTYTFHINEASKRANRPLVIAPGIKKKMEEAGFVDVQEHTTIWPMGPWPRNKELKELGRWGRVGMTESAFPFALALLSREGWAVEKIKELADDTITAIKKNKYYYQGWFVHGRKPVA